MKEEQLDKIHEGKFIMAGVEGVLEDFSRRGENFTNEELRSCMARMAKELQEARERINEGTLSVTRKVKLSL